jgi:flagellar basal body-associated protein FliL
MVEKAKLDVLENLPDIELTDVKRQPEEQDESSLSASGERWALNKLLLIGAPALIVVLVITGALWFYLTRSDNTVTKLKSGTPAAMIENKKPVSAEKISTQATIEPVKANNIYFKDFIVDLKDKTGKSKILLCDVVFDVNEAEKIAELENRNDIRNLIYQTATGRNAVVLRSIEERKRLKKDLLQELNKILGDGVVKNVYFTNYVIM